MKKYIILAAALCCPMCAMPAYAAPAKQTISRQAADYIMSDMIDLMDEIVSLFEEIYDKDSADAAAEKLTYIVAKVKPMMEQFDRYQPDSETEVYLEQKYASRMIELDVRMKAAMEDLQENLFYGSKDFVNACVEMGKL